MTTEIRQITHGYVATRGKRELYITANSANAAKTAQRLLAAYSFNKLYNFGRKPRIMHNTSHIVINGDGSIAR